MILGIMTLSIITLGIMILGIMPHGIMTNDTMHNLNVVRFHLSYFKDICVLQIFHILQLF